MAKRKINLEKLSDEQLAAAEQKISEKINQSITQLSEKWTPNLEKYGITPKIQVVIDSEDVVEVQDKAGEDFFNQHLDDEKYGVIARELDTMSKEMTKDLTDTIAECNKLLTRYGMACDMAFVKHI